MGECIISRSLNIETVDNSKYVVFNEPGIKAGQNITAGDIVYLSKTGTHWYEVSGASIPVGTLIGIATENAALSSTNVKVCTYGPHTYTNFGSETISALARALYLEGTLTATGDYFKVTGLTTSNNKYGYDYVKLGTQTTDAVLFLNPDNYFVEGNLKKSNKTFTASVNSNTSAKNAIVKTTTPNVAVYAAHVRATLYNAENQVNEIITIKVQGCANRKPSVVVTKTTDDQYDEGLSFYTYVAYPKTTYDGNYAYIILDQMTATVTVELLDALNMRLTSGVEKFNALTATTNMITMETTTQNDIYVTGVPITGH